MSGDLTAVEEMPGSDHKSGNVREFSGKNIVGENRVQFGAVPVFCSIVSA